MERADINFIIKELSLFNAHIYQGLPPIGLTLGSHDLIVLNDWSAQDLLSVARTQACQVVLFSEKPISESLNPFFDWWISDLADLHKLLETKKHYSSPNVINKKMKQALFLDRDGVVNVDHGYVGQVKKVELIPHVSQLIAKANRAKKEVVVITNQSGIGRGYYSEENFQEVMRKISDLLLEDGGEIDLVEHSSYHPSAKHPQYLLRRQFRKPRPGMIHQAAVVRGIDLKNSLMIGDQAKDLMTAVLAGVGRVCLLATEESAQVEKSFRSWILDLGQQFNLTQLMDGISLHIISGLDEAGLWL